MTFWLNGEWRGDRNAIGIDDRGFLLGDGVFETILIRDGVAAFLDRHIARLKSGLKMLSIAAALPDDLRAIIAELAARNDLRDCDASLRLTITRGPSARGLAFPAAGEAASTILMTIARANIPAGGSRALMISNHPRAAVGVAARCKTPSYIDNIIAYNEAIAAGVDDAVMLNPDGAVACASAANLFVITEGVVVTPCVSDGALPGIVRGVLLDHAAAAGVAIQEKSVAPTALRDGAAVFLTNSLIGLAPAHLSGAPTAHTNELFIRLDACYRAALAEDLRQAGAA